MLRAVLEGLLLFIVPFAGFAIYLIVRGENPAQPDAWSRQVLSWLTIAALIVCIGGIFAWGTRNATEHGTFVPSHVDKDGNFVPGRFKP